MDSEDDMHSDYGDNDDEDDADDHGDDDVILTRQQKNYTVLKEEDIKKRQEDDITKIVSVLSISRDSACMLLRRFSWSVTNVLEEWFANEDKVRKAVGLLENIGNKVPKSGELLCGICFELYPVGMISTAACGHPFCNTCWTACISISINDGPGCLTLRCPIPSCGSAVGVDMINMLTTEKDKSKYRHYLLRSYIEDNRKTKWCPAPGCDCAIEFDLGSGSYDVTCHCSHSFCWNCTEEAHRPVDCDTVSEWIRKNSAESANIIWILNNSKPCPMCRRPIERDQGCMHMTCNPPCKYEFCWMCLGQWSDHGESNGGFYACNRYEAAKKDRTYDEDERRRARAENSIQRYIHYYERWATNQSSRQKAIADLHQMQTVHLAKLSVLQSTPETNLIFILEAWMQIVECRQVLKWTYVYTYYMSVLEYEKTRFIEYLQGEAEIGLETLHHCAEKELHTYLSDRDPPHSQEEFNNFRTKLIILTSVTRNYFENLVRALENGLSEVPGTSKQKFRLRNRPRNGGASSRTDEGSCDFCTYVNPKTATRCAMCDQFVKNTP